MAIKTEAKVEFNADISGFQSKIDTLRKDITGLNNTLKLNAEKLKGDANNVDLLNQRKDLLNKKLNQTTEIVNAVNDKLQAQIETFGEDSEQVRKTTNELLKAQTQEQAIRNELNKVNSQIEIVTAALENNSKELEDNRNSYEKLQDTVKEQKEELSKLCNEYKNTILEQGKTSNEAKELKNKIDSLSVELAKNKKALSEVEDALGDVDEAANDASNGGFTVFKGVLSDLVSSGIKNCISGLKDLGKSIVDTGIQFTSSMSKVQAISGATDSELSKLEETAKELGASTKFTASEVADGFQYMALAGWDTQSMIKSIPSVLNLATAADMDLAKASDIVTDYLTAFNLGIEDTERFVDQMAYAMSNSNTNVEQLGEAYKNVAATSTQLGYSLEDTTSALMVMANSGIKGGEAGTALSSIMTRLGNDTSGCREMLEQYGIQVYDSQGNVNSLSSILGGMQGVWNKLTEEQKANLSYIVAGKTAQTELMTVLGDSTGSFTEYSNGLKGVNGTAQEMADTMSDNLGGDLTTLSSQLESLGLALFETLEEPLRSLIGFANDTIIPVISWCLENIPLLEPILIGIAALLAGQKVAMIAWTAATNLQAIAQGALNLVLSMNPISLIIIAIMALVAAFVYLWNHCEGFRNFFIKLWDGLKNAVSSAYNFFKSIFEKIKDIVVGFATKIGDTIKGIIKGAINSIMTLVENVINSPINAINGLLNIINKVPGINIPTLKTFSLPRLKSGMNYVPNDKYGPVYLDEGERVLTKEENRLYTNGLSDAISNNINSQSNYYSNNFNYEKLDRACDLLERIADKDTSLYIDSNEVAKATASADDEIAGDIIDLKNRGLEM